MLSLSLGAVTNGFAFPDIAMDLLFVMLDNAKHTRKKKVPKVRLVFHECFWSTKRKRTAERKKMQKRFIMRARNL
jgi:hypothetical protein